MRPYRVYFNRSSGSVRLFLHRKPDTRASRRLHGSEFFIETLVIESWKRPTGKRGIAALLMQWFPWCELEFLPSSDAFNEAQWLQEGFELVGNVRLGDGNDQNKAKSIVGLLIAAAEQTTLVLDGFTPGQRVFVEQLWNAFHGFDLTAPLPDLGPLLIGPLKKPHFGDWLSA